MVSYCVSGVVLKASSNSNGQEDTLSSENKVKDHSQSWSAHERFSNFKYWTLDTPPQPDDKLMTGMKWISTAQCVSQ